ncbi:MAG: isochorismatase family protein [Alphaproteobacteria bacterium]
MVSKRGQKSGTRSKKEKVANPKLSPDDAFLVFADLQVGIVDLPLANSAKDLVRAAKGLARLGEIFDIPTLTLSIPKRGGGRAVIIPEITETRSKYKHLERTAPDSFENAAIRKAIADSGRNTLVVCGIATEIAVHWLVLSGLANGYRVYVVADACGGLSVRSEEAAFRRFEAAGAVMTSVASFASEISGDFTKPIGRAAIDVVYDLIGV